MSSEFAGDYVEKDELLGLNQLGCALGRDESLLLYLGEAARVS